MLDRCSCVAAVAAVLAIISLASPIVAASAEDLARRNKEAVDSIATLHCVYTKRREGPKGVAIGPSPELHYWRDGNSFRIKCNDGKQSMEMIVNGLEMTTYRIGSPKNKVISKYMGLPLEAGDPWLDSYFRMPNMALDTKGGYPQYLDDIVRMTGMTTYVDKQSEGGRNYSVVSAYKNKVDGIAHYWIDESKNCLIYKAILLYKVTAGPTEEIRDEMVVNRFTELSAGVYFPTSFIRTVVANGSLKHRDVSECKNTIANKTISPALFKADALPSDHIFDVIANTQYTVGADGKSRINVRPMPTPTDIPPPTAADVAIPATDNDWSPWKVASLVFASVLVAIAIHRIYRLRR